MCVGAPPVIVLQELPGIWCLLRVIFFAFNSQAIVLFVVMLLYLCIKQNLIWQ